MDKYGKKLTRALQKMHLGYTTKEYKFKLKLAKMIKQGKITQKQAHKIWINKN